MSCTRNCGRAQVYPFPHLYVNHCFSDCVWRDFSRSLVDVELDAALQDGAAGEINLDRNNKIAVSVE